jgi:hypothetical protein
VGERLTLGELAALEARIEHASAGELRAIFDLVLEEIAERLRDPACPAAVRDQITQQCRAVRRKIGGAH